VGRTGIGLVTALTICALSDGASASPAEVFGFGSANAGRAGAVSATVDDFASGYYNPAGLAFGGPGKQVTIGALGAYSHLTIEDRHEPLSEPLGIIVGLRAPAPLGGPLKNRLFVGLGLYLLPGTVVQIKARLPDEPFYPYYDNRTQRIVVLPTVAARITEDLSVGVAVNFLATLQGRVTASEGATRALEARVDEEIPSIARLNAGVRWRPPGIRGVDLALTFRQSFSIPFATVAETMVAGEPINLDIAADGVYTPTQVVAGGAYSTKRASIGLDLVWANWSAYPGPYVQVKSELPLVGPLAGELPDVPYKDTFGARVGGQVAVGPSGDVILRGGYAFESSAVPAVQRGVTNLLDGHKNTVALGLGLRVPQLIGDHDVRFDLHGSAQLVAHRTLHKTIYDGTGDYDPFTSLRDEVTDDPSDPATRGAQISNPGYPNLRSGGEVYSAGLTMEVGF